MPARFLCDSDVCGARGPRATVIPFLVTYHSYVAQTVSLCPIPPHFVKFGNVTSFFRIGIIPIIIPPADI